MKPIKFKEQNVVFTKPDNMTDEECSSLPAFRSEREIISCWKLSPWERIKVLFTGIIWFSVLGRTQPPIWLAVHYPFIKEAPVDEQ